MRKIIGIISALIVLGFTGCNTIHYSRLDGDPLSSKELSEEETAYQGEELDTALVLETFDDDRYEEGFNRHSLSEIKEGALIAKPMNSDVNDYISYENPDGFSSVTVCWKETSTRGHLILWVEIPGFGMPTFFNNPDAVSAHVHLDSLNGDTESLGHIGVANQNKWIVQKVSIEGETICMYRNGRLVFDYPIEKAASFNRFTIGSNDYGAGALDWIAVK